jgi:MFS family permease
MKKIWGVRKNIFVLGLVSFFNDFSSEMVASAFPAFFTSVLRSGAGALGLIEGVADGLANFVKIYSGRISDKIKKRKIFTIIGYSLSTLSRPFYIFVTSVVGVAGLRWADRLGKGLRDSPRDALISLSVSRDELGKSFGFHRAMDTLGGVLGPIAAFFILEIFPAGFTELFLTAFFVGLIALITLFFVSDKTAEKEKSAPLDGTAFSWRFKFYLISVFILSIGSIPVAILLLKVNEIRLSIGLIPLLYAIYNLAFAFLSWKIGQKVVHLGHRNIIISGYFILLIGYILLNSAGNFLTLITTFITFGFFQAMTDGVHRAYTARLCDEEKRGQAYGLLAAATGFGSLIAGAGGGYLWEKASPTLALSIASIFIIIGATIFVLTQHRQNKTR